MKERPILFSAPMVRAILAGAKTQTRRVITSHKKAAPYFVVYADRNGSNRCPVYSEDGERGHYTDAQGYDVEERMHCPYGAPGDKLWVRETFCDDWKDTRGVQYRADGGLDGDMADAGCTWRPSIHMPRWASRITLEVSGVRVERLQDISEADAIAEGVHSVQCNDLGTEVPYYRSLYEPRDLYKMLWESINGPGSWDANPFVWVVAFKRVATGSSMTRTACQRNPGMCAGDPACSDRYCPGHPCQRDARPTFWLEHTESAVKAGLGPGFTLDGPHVSRRSILQRRRARVAAVAAAVITFMVVTLALFFLRTT